MEALNFVITVDPDLQASDAVLGLLHDRLSHLQPVIDQETAVMQQAQQENYAGEGAAFAGGWAPLAPSTLAQKRRQGYPERTLYRTGKLEENVGQAVEQTDDGDFIGATVGIDLSVVPYAAYHQSGTSRMPARLLVAVTQEEEQEMQETLQSFFDDIPDLPPGAVQVSLL